MRHSYFLDVVLSDVVGHVGGEILEWLSLDLFHFLLLLFEFL